MNPVAPARPLRLGVLISGGGSTLDNLIQRIADNRLRNVVIRLVISSRPDVRGLIIARNAGLETLIIRPSDFPDPDAYAEALARTLEAADVQLVVMAGFLSLWKFPGRFDNRVINIHPALLPAFGGQGMFGRRVHEAVLASGATESGCTVHLADHEYDHGPIISQRRVPVLPGDTGDSLAARVAQAEQELYPEVIQQAADHWPDWPAGVRKG